MVKFELGKRDFVWMSLIVVLLCIGFTYGFGGNNPAVMGHSVDEIEGAASIDYVNEYVNNQTMILQAQIDTLNGNTNPTPSYSGCPRQSVNWGSGCGGIVSAGAHGVVRTVSAGNYPFQGSVVVSCNNGAWMLGSGSCVRAHDH